MKFRNLGRSGLKVSELCLGTMQFGWTADEDTSYQVLQHSYENGINFLDTANVYSQWVEGNPGGVAEEIIGRWIKKYQIPRDQLVIATKVRGKRGEGPNDAGLSRVHILREVENSLRRLQVDTIDLYQMHSFDPQVPIEETLSALTDLVRQGKVRYIGCSNYPAWRLMQSLWAADRLHLEPFISVQPNYSLVRRNDFEGDGLVEVCQTYGIGVIPYSPLAAGFLTGKYRREGPQIESMRKAGASRFIDERSWDVLDVVVKIAAQQQASPSQVAIAWLLQQPVITSPIIGPRSVEQLQDNLGSVDLHLDQSQVNQLNEVSALDKK